MTTDNPPQHPGLEIFKAGTHTAVDGTTLTFSAADVAEIADSYNAALSEAPIVVGHPELNAPAYGWAKSLRAENGVLYAEPQQVDAEFAEMVNKGRFKKISASIYLPGSAGNPAPGKHYLRHIGFLGAKAPAVKGLKSASFADSDGAVEFSSPMRELGYSLVDVLQRMRDYFIDALGLEKADQIVPQWTIRGVDEVTRRADADKFLPMFAAPGGDKNPESTMSNPDRTAEFAEREQKLSDQQTALNNREKTLSDRENKARRDDAVAFAEQLVTDGKVLPRHRPEIVELLMLLPAGSTVSFGEGEQTVTKPAADSLRALLNDLPPQINYREKSGEERAPAVASFAAPAGAAIDAGRLGIYEKAKAYQAQHPGTVWAAAVAAVGG